MNPPATVQRPTGVTVVFVYCLYVFATNVFSVALLRFGVLPAEIRKVMPHVSSSQQLASMGVSLLGAVAGYLFFRLKRVSVWLFVPWFVLGVALAFASIETFQQMDVPEISRTMLYISPLTTCALKLGILGYAVFLVRKRVLN